MEIHVPLSRFDSPKKAVHFLRTFAIQRTPVSWHIVEMVATLHFGSLPKLPQHFSYRNSTGLAAFFDEGASHLTASLPNRAAHPTHPLAAPELEMEVYRITLLELLARIVESLHNQEETIIDLGGHQALKQAA